jgi:hypothetical protein
MIAALVLALATTPLRFPADCARSVAVSPARAPEARAFVARCNARPPRILRVRRRPAVLEART